MLPCHHIEEIVRNAISTSFQEKMVSDILFSVNLRIESGSFVVEQPGITLIWRNLEEEEAQEGDEGEGKEGEEGERRGREEDQKEEDEEEEEKKRKRIKKRKRRRSERRR